MNKKISIVITLVLMVSIIQGSTFANTQNALSAQTSKVESAKPSNRQETMMSKNIIEVASEDGRFKTLVTALRAAGLEETLKGNGPFTVFAPTDDAFAKLSPGTLDDLLKPENKDTLVNILTYHVVPGKVMAKDAMKLDGKEVDMLNGNKAKIEVRDGSVYIDGAKVIVTDVMAKNGVIHVIDTVMTPPTDRKMPSKVN